MRVLIINSVCGIRSTGRICSELAERLISEGNIVRVAYGRFDVPERCMDYAVRIGNKLSPFISALDSRVFDNDGFNCKRETKRFLKWANDFNPDLLWIHNVHDHFIDINQLFNWIKGRPNMTVKWTLHDCWPFTGHCVYFSYCKCEKWKSGCKKCPQKRTTPTSFVFDRSQKNYRLKKQLFTGVGKLKLITPSQWLADLTRESFLSEYEVEVVHNTIDTNVFRHRKSDFKTRYCVDGKRIILGVAMPWTERKGLRDFLELSSLISDNEVIVLVGLNKKQIKKLPSNIIGIEKTNNAIELAEIYSAADVFFNPTYEDNYPTTNLEAQACGTPCVTYDTGGSSESVPSENVVHRKEGGGVSEAYEIIKNLL